jgi:hypothetical protein
MYKKLAAIGPISCGIFLALLMLIFYLCAVGYGYAMNDVEFVNGINAPATIALSMAGITLPVVDPSQINVMGIAYGAGLVFAVGLVIGIVIALVYNIVAAITGGIKVKTHDIGYDDY